MSLPPISPGHETFSGRCLHSMEYKDADAFKEKRVIVVGIGNSGGDIASEISRHATKVDRMREALLFARKEGKCEIRAFSQNINSTYVLFCFLSV